MTTNNNTGRDHVTNTASSLWLGKRGLAIGSSIALGAAITAGVAFALGYHAGGDASHATDAGQPTDSTVWTCAMHPQVKLPQPGKCPICFMDLIPLAEPASGSGNPRELTMTRAAMALADIQTAPVRRQFVTNTIRMVGKVDFDETKLATITAWVPGRLDRLYIDYTGVTVRKGDHLVEMYSPDLIVAQRELIQAVKSYARFGAERGDRLVATTVKSTEEKLRLMGLTDKQIEDIKQRGTPSERVTIYAPIGGVVVHMDANEGMSVQTGTRLYTIADLSQVWVYIDAYESDVPWIRYGQEVEFSTESYPGDIFKGRVSFIPPILNEKTRTMRVRVNVPNTDGRLKPGMFVRALIKSRLAESGQVVDASMAGKWVSPHHPEIIRDGPGTCPICGIDLVPAETLGFVQADAGAEPPLVIPASAPLLTGKRAVVYVKDPTREEPTFHGREVLLGARVSPPPGAGLPGYSGDYYIVRHGLFEGEEVVTNGNFKIDSALQIAAKPSMMSPAGGGHQHHGGDSQQPTSDPYAQHRMAQIEVPSEFRVALSTVYRAYLDTSEALARDDLALTRRRLDTLLKAVNQIDVRLLDDDGRGRWKTVSDKIIFATHAAMDAVDRESTRPHFEHLSGSMLTLVQAFGHALEQPVYQFHCPMAFKNKGASWLQATAQTRNPYFGPSMLACGDPMATFHPQVPLVVPASFRGQLATIYREYLKLQTDLAADEAQQAVEAVTALRSAVESVDAAELDGRASQTWMIAYRQLVEALSTSSSSVDLADLRQQFEDVSLAMLGIVENFGHASKTALFMAHCPMAFDNKGAAWLQADEKVANPYFGAKMFRCGSIQRTFSATHADQEDHSEGDR